MGSTFAVRRGVAPNSLWSVRVRGWFLLPVAFLVCGGTWLHGAVPGIEFGAGLLFVLVVAAWRRLWRGYSATALLMPAFLLGGALRTSWHVQNVWSSEAVQAFMQARPGAETVVVTGVFLPPAGADTLVMEDRRIEGLLAHARLWNGKRWQRVDVPIRVVLYGHARIRPRPGETWKLQGRLRPRRSPLVRGGRTWGLAFSGDIRQASRRAMWFDWLDLPGLLAARRGMTGLLQRGIEDAATANAVIGAMVLGYRRALPAHVQEAFRRTGTAHVFAISGLHVGILCALAIGCFRLFRIPRRVWVIPLMPVICGYAFLTGGRPSAWRACLMAACYFAAPLFGRRPRVTTALAVAAIIIALWTPMQVRDPGFIYSFVIVGGIIALAPLFERLLLRQIAPHPLALPETDRHDGLRRMALRYAGGLMAVSVAAWLSSAPLTAYYFNRLSPVALPANMLAVPLAFLIILTSTLSIIAGSCVSGLGIVLNHTNLLWVSMQTTGMRLLAALPAASVPVPSPPLTVIVVYYGCLLGIALSMSRNSTSGLGRDS